MILLIDNYDSFTYNIFQEVTGLGFNCHVVRNDMISLEEIEFISPEKIILSPGPGRPVNAGICLEIIKEFAGKIPIFGICLGMQAIGGFFGAKLIYASEIVHGKTSLINHNQKGVFEGLAKSLNVTRYHSLALGYDSIPNCFEVTALTEKGEVMGIRHNDFELEGVQFHPESYATEGGREMLNNFLKRGEQNASLSTDII